MQTLATFKFGTVDDVSPGVLSFAYVLVADGVVYTPPGGHPAVPAPVPDNNSPVCPVNGSAGCRTARNVNAAY